MKPALPLVLLLAAVFAGSGCASKSYVKQRIASANAPQDSKLSDHDTRLGALDSSLSAMNGELAATSATARDALARATAAGKLAEGKFLYEMALQEGVSFKFGSSTLTPAARDTLADLAERLKSENKGVYLEIQGHTDNTGSDALNLAIGQQRAAAVHHFLATQGGLPLHRMNTISYGETSPVASNKTRAGRAENRRVVVVVLQ
jgi:outer membrane protein OmpA-like peptidoglycan-associated protein